MVRLARRDKVAVAALALLLAGARPAAAQVPPDEAWRTLETAHFRVTFPARLEGLGRVAADRAEAAWDSLAAAFVEPPDHRVELLLTDHVDVSNGLTDVVPYSRITIYARPPVDGFALSYFDDWMRLVITHELAHAFHLERTSAVGSLLRDVFGRVPAPWPFFPEMGTPRWVIEGLAVYYESALTPSGRVEGTYHDMVLRTALLEGRFESIDQASGLSPAWPGGNRPYIYGSLFFDWLLERHGRDKLKAFADAVAGQWIPYRMNAAAKAAFGASFSDEWAAWRTALEAELARTRARAEAGAPLTRPEALTEDARLALYPAVSPDGARLVYALNDGRSDAQLRVAAPDGSGARELTRTNGDAPFAFAPDGRVVVAQLDFTDRYHLYADLWSVGPGGDARRLTEGARLEQPSVAPDGRVVAVRTDAGAAALVEVDPADGTVRALTPAAPRAPWGFPAVSPDGRWIAAVRWGEGPASDLLVLDRDGREVARVTRDAGLELAPAWARGDTLVWASDRSGVPNLYALALDPATGRPAGPVRQVTNVLTGVGFPSVDPAGRWLYFSQYHADGWNVARVPWDPSAWFDPLPEAPRFAQAEARSAGGGARPGAQPPGPGLPPVGPQARQAPVKGYSPWPTLLPRYWEPLYREGQSVTLPGGRSRQVLGPGLGLATSAFDLVGRHALAAALTWSTSGGRTEGYVSYRWAGLGNPVLGLSLDQTWDVGGPLLGDPGGGAPLDTLFLRTRERTLSASAAFEKRRFRWVSGLTLSGGLVWEGRELLDQALEPSQRFTLTRPGGRLADAAATVSFSTLRGHAFALGVDEGVGVSVRGRLRRELDLPDTLAGVVGSDRAYQEVIGQARAFHGFPAFGYAHHVLGVRASGGVATGPGADRFHFDVGGASGAAESLTGFGLLGGHGYLFPVRGYPNGERSGRYAWSATAEYRVPLALVNRGLGLLPVNLDRVQASLFADAGNAWGPELGTALYQNPRRAVLASAGAELTVHTLLLFSSQLDVRVGLAVPFLAGFGPSLYVRLGQAF